MSQPGGSSNRHSTYDCWSGGVSQQSPGYMSNLASVYAGGVEESSQSYRYGQSSSGSQHAPSSYQAYEQQSHALGNVDTSTCYSTTSVYSYPGDPQTSQGYATSDRTEHLCSGAEYQGSVLHYQTRAPTHSWQRSSSDSSACPSGKPHVTDSVEWYYRPSEGTFVAPHSSVQRSESAYAWPREHGGQSSNQRAVLDNQGMVHQSRHIEPNVYGSDYIMQPSPNRSQRWQPKDGFGVTESIAAYSPQSHNWRQSDQAKSSHQLNQASHQNVGEVLYKNRTANQAVLSDHQLSEKNRPSSTAGVFTSDRAGARALNQPGMSERHVVSARQTGVQGGRGAAVTSAHPPPHAAALPNSPGIRRGSAHTLSVSSRGAHTSPVSSKGVHASPVSSRGVHLSPVSSRGIHASPVSSRGVHASPVSSRGVHASPVSSRGIHASSVSSRGVHASPASSRGAHASPASSRGVHKSPVSSRGVHASPVSSRGVHASPVSSRGVHKSPVSSRGVHASPASSRGVHSSPTLPVTSRGVHASPVSSRGVPSRGQMQWHNPSALRGAVPARGTGSYMRPSARGFSQRGTASSVGRGRAWPIRGSAAVAMTRGRAAFASARGGAAVAMGRGRAAVVVGRGRASVAMARGRAAVAMARGRATVAMARGRAAVAMARGRAALRGSGPVSQFRGSFRGGPMARGQASPRVKSAQVAFPSRSQLSWRKPKDTNEQSPPNQATAGVRPAEKKAVVGHSSQFKWKRPDLPEKGTSCTVPTTQKDVSVSTRNSGKVVATPLAGKSKLTSSAPQASVAKGTPLSAAKVTPSSARPALPSQRHMLATPSNLRTFTTSKKALLPTGAQLKWQRRSLLQARQARALVSGQGKCVAHPSQLRWIRKPGAGNGAVARQLMLPRQAGRGRATGRGNRLLTWSQLRWRRPQSTTVLYGSADGSTASRFRLVRRTPIAATRQMLMRRSQPASLRPFAFRRQPPLSSTPVFYGKKQVQIGGALYRVSRRSLRRVSMDKTSQSVANTVPTTAKPAQLPAASVAKSAKSPTIATSTSTSPKICQPTNKQKAGSLVVSVRGVRFSLENSGRTLRRLDPVPAKDPASMLTVSTQERSAIRRINIGGITYVQTAPGKLVRKSQEAQVQLARHAVRRSLVLLRAKSSRRTDDAARYCMFFNRYGRCGRGTACPYIHDKDKVAVCTKFLHGKCDKTDGSCLLSHKLSKNKMPACFFFLGGSCHKDDCPYAHVNVSRTASVCEDFVHGYCPRGEKCEKKHVLPSTRKTLKRSHVTSEQEGADAGATSKSASAGAVKRRRSSNGIRMPSAFRYQTQKTMVERPSGSVAVKAADGDSAKSASGDTEDKEGKAPLRIKPSFIA